jgi:CRP/FNR family transcriptional regulator, cyclic AMP receptor protein
MELLQILKGAELFRGLTAAQLERLVTLAEKAEFHAEQTIFEQGSLGKTMFIIGKGQVEISFHDSDGDYPEVYLGAGQVFGEMALLDQGARSASVVAVQDETILYGIPSDRFMTLCEQDTAIGFILMRNLALDLSFKLRHKNLDPSTSL